MNVRIFFKGTVERCTSFRWTESAATVCDGEVTLYSSSDGRWYYDLYSDQRIHPKLVGLVDEVSMRDRIQVSHSIYARREAGIYNHETARAEVSVPQRGFGKDTDYHQNISISAKNMEDARELLHLIKTGQIRPTESYEGPQTGKSAAELHEELAEAQATIERMKQEREAMRKIAEELRRGLNELAEIATSGSYFMLGRGRRVAEILKSSRSS